VCSKNILNRRIKQRNKAMNKARKERGRKGRIISWHSKSQEMCTSRKKKI
jgi:hypothetical protein